MFLAFIRGLLENVGAEIDPIRLIRRIKNGLEIPGLKEALIKILQAFNLQISLLEGCQTILEGDCSTLARKLNKDQTKGFFGTGKHLYSIILYRASPINELCLQWKLARNVNSALSHYTKTPHPQQ